MTRPQMVCIGCRKSPADLDCYTLQAAEEGISADAYAWREEGTLNRENGHLLCDDCYIAWGMPAGRNGQRWVAP